MLFSVFLVLISTGCLLSCEAVPMLPTAENDTITQEIPLMTANHINEVKNEKAEPVLKQYSRTHNTDLSSIIAQWVKLGDVSDVMESLDTEMDM